MKKLVSLSPLRDVARRQFMVRAAAMSAVVSLAACGDSKPPPAPATPAATASPPAAPAPSKPVALHLGLNPWAGVMPLKVATDAGLAKAHGLDLKITLFPTISQMMEAFNAGAVDATIIDPGTLLVSAANGVAQKWVFVTDFSAGADAIVATPKIADVKALKGRKVSAEIGSIGHFLLLTALGRAGLKASDVKIVNQTADAAGAAFAAGRIEACASYEPFIGKVLADGRGHVLFSTRDASIAPDVVSVRQAWLDVHPDGVGRLIDLWFAAVARRESDLDAAIVAEAKALEVSADEFRAITGGVKLNTTPAEVAAYMGAPAGDATTLATLCTDLVAFLRAQKLLDRDPPPAEQLIDTRWLAMKLA
jgi:NitT/TauT family transport system substrate-binding protein